MKTKCKLIILAACRLIGGAGSAGAVLLIAAIAPAQNLFVSNQSPGGPIYEFTPDGVRSDFVLGLPYTLGLAFDRTGNLFVGVQDLQAIYKETPSRQESQFATGLYDPWGLAFNSAGKLFEADANGLINEFTTTGIRTTFAGGLSHYSHALAFNNAGILFVADQNSGNIYEFTPAATRSTFASGLNKPTGLAFDSAGNLFVADDGSGNLLEFTPGGSPSTVATGLGNATGLAIQGQTLPVPEPSALALLAIGAGLWFRRRHGNA